jgi:tetratricopeptide (TPR) repeat protein
VRRAPFSLFLGLLGATLLVAQESSDPLAQALSQGDLYQSKRKYELALDAYHKADKLAHHNSAQTYLKLAGVERKLGDFSTALDDAKKAVKVAGENKTVAVHAHLLRANLLIQMAGKSTDKKLKEAEEEIRQALALNSTDTIVHYDLGFVLLKQERDPEGIAELNTFLSMPGADAETAAEARRMVANPLRARAPFAPASSSEGGKPAGDSAEPLFGIEASSISGNVYKNDALSMSYEFPRGWIAAKPESLHALNDRSEAGAKAAILQQHPELADSLRFSVRKIVFYASRRGDGDGQRLGLPSLRISATPSRLDSLRLDTFQQMMDHMAAASGLKLSAPASEYTVNKHQFLRADFERTSGGARVYQSYVQTLSEDYLLTIEIFASSPEELQQAAASLQSMAITEEAP